MRRFFEMPPQLFRIFLLAVGIVVVYSIARYFLTPPSFGEYGWYRGAALAELATRDRVYAGKKACEECHSDEYQKVMKHEHKGLSCEGCHGPGEAHAEDPRTDNIEKSSLRDLPAMPRGQSLAAQMAQTDREQEPLHRIQVHGMPRATQPVGGPMKQPGFPAQRPGQDQRCSGRRAGGPRGQSGQSRGAEGAGFHQRAEGL